jgi:hypothetical protein
MPPSKKEGVVSLDSFRRSKAQTTTTRQSSNSGEARTELSLETPGREASLQWAVLYGPILLRVLRDYSNTRSGQ